MPYATFTAILGRCSQALHNPYSLLLSIVWAYQKLRHY